MRILALITDAFGGFGGIAAYNRNFLSALAEGGAQVSALPRIGIAQQVPAGIHQGPPRFSPAAYSAAALWLAFRDRSFDAIWCGHLRMLPLARLVKQILDRPIWLQVHGIEAWNLPSPKLKAATEGCSMITAVSRYTRHRLLGWADIPGERVRVLQNCIDESFYPGPRRDDLRARYSINQGPVLLTISRLSASERYKGHDRMLRAIPQLARRFPGLVYIIGGDGDDRMRLEALAKELGVIENCRFMGRIPEDEKVDHYRLADLFVMPSTGEGFGIVFLEAMACGIPAVGLDMDGSVDPLSACRLGYAVPEEHLTESISAILSEPPPRPDGVSLDLYPFSRKVFGQRVRALAEEVATRSATHTKSKRHTGH